MHGNVAEWCEDPVYATSYDGIKYVLSRYTRGGSCSSNEKTGSSATNNSNTSSSNNSNPNATPKSSASYDTEYKSIELKPIKTHPKVVVPEEIELEP